MPCVYCVLCGNRDKLVSYHTFPKDEETRKQWLAFCGIKEDVLNTVTKLCANHFREEDFIKKAKGTRTKPNALPSVHGKKRKRSQQSDSVNEVYCSAPKTNITIDYCNIPIKDTSVTVNNCCILHSIENIQSSCQTPPKVESQSYVDIIGASDSGITEELLNIATDDVFTPLRDEGAQCSSYQTPTKKTVYEPRYVGDIRSSHLATPRKAQRALNLAKKTIAQQRRKIKTLQTCRYRLVAHIKTMKNLIKHLKEKNLILEAIAENLKVEVPEIMNEILKRKKGSRENYSAELRSFALTLNF